MSTWNHVAPLLAARIVMPGGQCSWTVLDAAGGTVQRMRDWIVHLEQTNMSPNTVRAYLRHVVDLANFLSTNGADLPSVTVVLYDRFLAWRMSAPKGELPSAKLIRFRQEPKGILAATTRNQIQLAVKSLYRFLNGTDDFAIDTVDRLKAYDGHRLYKPFLEHISQRRTTRRKDRYLSGDLGRAQKRIVQHRLRPEQVLRLIECCHLARDVLLIVVLYNTGMRIGEALGLRHLDIDLAEKVIWIVPRGDNSNGARVKSGRIRGIPVHDYVLNMYVDYLTSNEYLPAFETGSEYVFTNVKAGLVGRALSLSYVYKLNSLLKRRSGLGFSWHLFRHSHASEAIAAGYNLIEIADRLGHVSPQTTAAFYQHLFADEIRKLYLTGPEQVQERLRTLRDATLVGKDIRWA